MNELTPNSDMKDTEEIDNPQPPKMSSGKGSFILVVLAGVALLAIGMWAIWVVPTKEDPVEPANPTEVIEVVEQPQYQYVEFDNDDEQIIDISKINPNEFRVVCNVFVCQGLTRNCEIKCDLAFLVVEN